MARDDTGIKAATLWAGREGGSARVLDVAAGYVRFVDQDDRVDVLHHYAFRERYLSPAETRQSVRQRFLDPATARRLGSQFAMSLANLASFHVFWSPTLKRMFARSLSVPLTECAAAARGRPALPADAVHVGTYADPASPDQFFEDLNDAIATDGCTGAL
jgi:hypothetical protein